MAGGSQMFKHMNEPMGHISHSDYSRDKRQTTTFPKRLWLSLAHALLGSAILKVASVEKGRLWPPALPPCAPSSQRPQVSVSSIPQNTV